MIRSAIRKKNIAKHLPGKLLAGGAFSEKYNIRQEVNISGIFCRKGCDFSKEMLEYSPNASEYFDMIMRIILCPNSIIVTR